MSYYYFTYFRFITELLSDVRIFCVSSYSNPLLHKLLKIVRSRFDGTTSKHNREVKYQKQTRRLFA